MTSDRFYSLRNSLEILFIDEIGASSFSSLFSERFPKFCHLISCHQIVKVKRDVQEKSFKPVGQSSISQFIQFQYCNNTSKNRTIVAVICSVQIHEELNITPSTQLQLLFTQWNKSLLVAILLPSNMTCPYDDKLSK